MTEKDRRTAILDAALSCFLKHGYRGTTLAMIRQASGATTGSIYHFFSGKADMAEKLARQAIAGWVEASPLPHASAETQIKHSIRGVVLWGLANPREARFLDEIRSLAVADPDLGGLRAFFSNGQDHAAAAFAAMQARGEVKKLPFPLAHALMLGPAYDYLRVAPPTEPIAARRIADLLAEAAWLCVRP